MKNPHPSAKEDPGSEPRPGRVVLITGASQGIGEATALEMARKGCRIALVARNETKLNAVAGRVRALSANPLVYAGDLADLSFARQVVDDTIRTWGQLDILINNAAWGENITMRKISLASWEKTLRLCLTTPAFLARWAAEAMERQGSGAIINVSSIEAYQSPGTGPAYVAAKGGLDALTRELATLYGPQGIRVLSIVLGAIDTEMSNSFKTGDGSDFSSRMRHWSEDMIPLQRWGSSEEAASVITWAAGPEASYLTGTTIIADGGWTHQLSPYSLKREQFPEQFLRNDP